jgi:pSer/pThr/pTyr-binding forkhead associated (FHA) protein
VTAADANGARARARAALLWGSVEIPLPEGEVVAGRDPDLPVRVAHPSVSRHHARLVVDANGMTIQDLASRNGTFVNEVRAERVTPLTPGDFVRLGSCVLRVVDTSAETRSTDSEPAPGLG